LWSFFPNALGLVRKEHLQAPKHHAWAPKFALPKPSWVNKKKHKIKIRIIEEASQDRKER
jgi:hypothetical protein